MVLLQINASLDIFTGNRDRNIEEGHQFFKYADILVLSEGTVELFPYSSVFLFVK